MAAKMLLIVSALILLVAQAASSNSTKEAAAPPLNFLGLRGSIAGNSTATEVKETSKAAGPEDMTSATMEAALTNLMLGKTAFGATPMGGSVQQIARILTQTMMPKIIAAHKADQSSLYRLRNEVTRCGSVKVGALRKANAPVRKYRSYSGHHKRCRRAESVVYAQKKRCASQQRAMYNEKVLRCRYYATISRQLGTQQANIQIVKKAGGERTENYIRRISTSICGRHVHGSKGQRSARGGWGGGLVNSMLDKYLKAKAKCQSAKSKYNAKVRDCRRKSRYYTNKKAQCNQYQSVMDTNSCQSAVVVKDACESYVSCWSSKKKAYRIFLSKAITSETDRKAEWRGLKRMECLIRAFADGKVTNREVDACKKASHSTAFLKLKYPNVPGLQKCTLPTLYPATGAYKRLEFAPLPNDAQGKEPAACAGIDVIPTSPRRGSPRGARCSRVPLNGAYSAGGLVKCTNGWDVYKSTQKNSCPTGTKLWSPASRSDWRTFLASAQPLRAPHWIIDITRPSNGCGGCRNPMNSRNNAQRTWKTEDGSPWWLRSTQFSEPNGDYRANCYLDLWHGKPRNARSVSMNDGNCNYHSRSYYCQPRKFGLKAKAGSPRSCKCSKVDLTGRYSAGLLVKCEQCLTVHRSTQKNSCPNGMKIFSPQSRQDWKTFLSSAQPLRAPNWIIDVTRPNNGCGGCTRSAMKGSTPQQSSWKTSDGSPWWLRSTRYSEPNGDYTANCFLDLWRTPANENSITFNDGRCNYRARSYYCQPKRGDKNYGGLHRRRRAGNKPAPKPAPAKPKPKAVAKMKGNGKSYKALAQMCASKGARLCNWKEYCPNGRGKNPKLGRERGDVWAPIGDSDNDWVQMADSRVCKKHSDHWGKPAWGKGNNPYAKVAYCCASKPAKLPRGVVTNFDMMGLVKAGWKTWTDVQYAHHTKTRDIQPNKGDCIMWGAKRSSGTRVLSVAAFGRRSKIKNSRFILENGVYWYTINGKSNGFSADRRLSLNSADTQGVNGAKRLSWHLGQRYGGYRSGRTTGLNRNRRWRKVVMYGPCS